MHWRTKGYSEYGLKDLLMSYGVDVDKEKRDESRKGKKRMKPLFEGANIDL